MSKSAAERFRRRRLGDIRMYIRVRYGRKLPADDAGRTDLRELLLHCLDSASMKLEALEFAPWLSVVDLDQLIGELERMPFYERMPKGTDLGERFRLTNTERERFKLWSIAPVDMTKEQLVEQRRAKAKAREQRRRLKLGAITREVYLAQAKKPKPWETANMSERSFYRRKAKAEAMKAANGTGSVRTSETTVGSGSVRIAEPDGSGSVLDESYRYSHEPSATEQAASPEEGLQDMCCTDIPGLTIPMSDGFIMLSPCGPRIHVQFV